jgi:hypothetical protein
MTLSTVHDEDGFSLVIECIPTACWFWKRYFPAPILENLRGYDSTFSWTILQMAHVIQCAASSESIVLPGRIEKDLR